MGVAAMAKAAEKDFEEFLKYAGCMDGEGKFLKREDGCCVHEDKECGCMFHNICRAKAGVKP
jgi:hypothetical protein